MTRLIALILLLTYIGANAQVVKCKDPSGKTIYSDVACPSSSSSASVNLSGGNITAEQLRSAQERKAAGAKNEEGGAQCPLLMNQAQRTFASFLENTNRNRWEVSFRAIENLTASCPTTETCQLVKARLDHAQQRYGKDNKSTRGEQLNSVTSLFAESCLAGSSAGASGRVASQPRAAPTTPNRSHLTKDEFGIMVNSGSCYMTKDVFGISRPSAGCK